MTRVLMPFSVLLAMVFPAAWAAAQPAALSDGQKAWLQCRACHSLETGAAHKLGPNLSGILGQKAGTRPGFTYSPALKASGLVWDRATLDRWIEKPGAVLKGHRMVFIGIADKARRTALVDYLATQPAGER